MTDMIGYEQLVVGNLYLCTTSFCAYLEQDLNDNKNSFKKESIKKSSGLPPIKHFLKNDVLMFLYAYEVHEDDYHNHYAYYNFPNDKVMRYVFLSNKGIVCWAQDKTNKTLLKKA